VDRSDIVGTPDETRADKLVHGRINRHHVHDPISRSGLGAQTLDGGRRAAAAEQHRTLRIVSTGSLLVR
jgi:hypothetical protein